MKVLVPVKRVIDAYVSIRVKSDGSGVDTDNVKMSLNPFCEIALEEAIRLKEAGVATEVILVSVGSAEIETVMRSGLAMGADRAIRVDTENDVEPLAIAKILKYVAEKEEVGLVITGKQSIDGDNNQTGQMLSALLGWSQATFASEVVIEGDSAKVTREIDGGLETVSIPMPAVVTTDLRLNEPRYPTLPNIMKAKKKPLDVIALADTGVDASKRQTVLNVSPPESRSAGVMVGSVAELVDKLKNEAKVIQWVNRIMTTLVIAHHDNAELHVSTLNTVTAAAKVGGDIHVLVAGSGAGAVATEAAKITGVAKVLHADADQYKDGISIEIANLVVSLAGDYSHIMAGSTTSGKDMLPRVAALIDSSQISDIMEVDSADTFKRPIYAGNAIATIQSTDSTIVLTVRPTGFDAAEMGGSAEVVAIEGPAADGTTSVVGRELTVSARPDLGAADIVVSGGRGVGSAENFKIIERLADKLGAAVGASRAAVDAGYVPNDYQVGQTGKVVAPNLYIAVGISGAIQHLAGMKDSKVIVAINKDEEAPIFQVADYGLVADLFEAVPELVEVL